MNISLNTAFIGKIFLYFDKLASTNTEAVRISANFPAEGTVVFAENQTQGRGQLGTAWEAAEGLNLTFSIILYPNFLALTDMFYLSKMVAVALHKCLEALVSPKKVEIKWANDILISGKKVAGILIENQIEGQQIKACMIGIGLNVNQLVFSEEIMEKTTSLCLEMGKECNREEVLVSLLEYIEVEYLSLKAGKYAELDAYYLAHLVGFGEKRRFLVGGEMKIGEVIGVEKSGRLVVDFEGEVQSFDIKEIVWVNS